MGLVRKVGMVIHPVEDLEAAIEFYRDALGCEVAFRDGDRFCALDAGGLRIGLAAGAERVAEVPAVSYRVDDVEEAVRALRAGGARVVRDVEDGPHERRAVLCDPAGNPLVVYSPA